MIKRGDEVKVKPEYQDAGDAAFVWRAVEDEDGGRVRIAPELTSLRFGPQYVVRVDMLEGNEV